MWTGKGQLSLISDAMRRRNILEIRASRSTMRWKSRWIVSFALCYKHYPSLDLPDFQCTLRRGWISIGCMLRDRSLSDVALEMRHVLGCSFPVKCRFVYAAWLALLRLPYQRCGQKLRKQTDISQESYSPDHHHPEHLDEYL